MLFKSKLLSWLASLQKRKGFNVNRMHAFHYPVYTFDSCSAAHNLGIFSFLCKLI